MRLTVAGAVALAALAQAQDQVITGQTRIVTPNAPLGNVGGTTTIERSALYWVSNGLVHAIQGSFDVYGQARVSNTDGTQTGMTSNYFRDVSNPNDAQVTVRSGGSFIVNDALSRSAPTFDWSINKLDNSGTMMWCSNGVGGGSTSLLNSRGDWHNMGVQAWSQTNPNIPNIQLSLASPSITGQTPTANIINDGNMILTNISTFRVPQNIIGNGCWTVGRASNLDLSFLTYNKAPNTGGAWTGQAINLVAQDSGIRFGATTVSAAPQILGMRVYGLGGSNGVGFQSRPMNIVYNPPGTLTFTVSGVTQSLSIGSGYTDGGFTTTLQNGYYMIQYPSGVPANGESLPSTCSLANELGDQCPTYERFVSSTTSSSMASTAVSSSSQQTTATSEISASSTLEISTSQSSTSVAESSSAASSTRTSSIIEISTSEVSTTSSTAGSTTASATMSTSESSSSSAAESTSATSSTTTSSSELTSESSSSSAAESATSSNTEITSTLVATTTLAPGPGNSTSATSIVSTDMFTGPYTTVTSTGSVTEATTITQAPGPSDSTGTVLVIVPSPSLTAGPDTRATSSASVVASITQTSGRSDASTTAVASVFSSGAPSFTGPYTTVTSVGTVTQTNTTTLAPGPGGSIGTVIVTVPKQTSDPNNFTGPCKTVTETACVTRTLILTQGPQPGKETGTAVVYVPGETKTFGGPCSTITKTACLTQGVITVTQAPRPGQQTGTVIAWVPTPTAGVTKGTAPPVTMIKSPASGNATVGGSPHGDDTTNPGQPGPSVVKASSASSLRGSFWMRCLAVLIRGL